MGRPDGRPLHDRGRRSYHPAPPPPPPLRPPPNPPNPPPKPPPRPPRPPNPPPNGPTPLLQPPIGPPQPRTNRRLRRVRPTSALMTMKAMKSVRRRPPGVPTGVSLPPISSGAPSSVTLRPWAILVASRDTPAGSPGPYPPRRNSGAIACRLVSP